VIRGEEWISSVPKHILLHQYLDFPLPEYCHLPLLRNPDKSKLSKRKNPTSIGFYRRMGFMPEVMLNYLGRMGWSMPGGEEKFTLQQMIENFDLERISLGAPVFDLSKLRWLNGLYIRELGQEELVDRLAEWALNREYLLELIPLVKERIDTFTELAPKLHHFFIGLPTLTPESFQHKDLSLDECKKILHFSVQILESEQEWTKPNVEARLRHVGQVLDMNVRRFLFPLFVATSGAAVSTPLFETLALLGKDLSRARLRNGVDVLGGISKKEDKAYSKECADLINSYCPPTAEG
jgi:glutamyl-tRNA synthetase